MIITSPNQLPEIKNSWYVFLAGPIQGAPEWQNSLPEIPGVTYLSPRRENCSNFNWDEQVAWETRGLKIADIILFWIPSPAEKIEGRDYAQTTRTEFGEYLALGKKIILGAYEGFPGRKYFATKLAQYGEEPIHASLEECMEEVKKFISDRKEMTWFTSDTHFGSSRALTLSCRPFKSTEEMDWTMIQRWNDRVKPGDKVYHLGDFGELWPLQYLNGDITLILGNYERKLVDGELTKLLTHPKLKVESSDMVDEFFLAHEPTTGLKMMKTEECQEKWLLFGHIHGRQKIKKFGIDVGVDGNNFAPISIDEVRFYTNAIEKGYYDDDVWCQ